MSTLSSMQLATSYPTTSQHCVPPMSSNAINPCCSKPTPKSKGDATSLRRPRQRRNKANTRERNRMHGLNDALDTLRSYVPLVSHHQKLSKIETLRLARNYITALKTSLQTKDAPSNVEYAQLLSRGLSQTTTNMIATLLHVHPRVLMPEHYALYCQQQQQLEQQHLLQTTDRCSIDGSWDNVDFTDRAVTNGSRRTDQVQPNPAYPGETPFHFNGQAPANIPRPHSGAFQQAQDANSVCHIEMPTHQVHQPFTTSTPVSVKGLVMPQIQPHQDASTYQPNTNTPYPNSSFECPRVGIIPTQPLTIEAYQPTDYQNHGYSHNCENVESTSENTFSDVNDTYDSGFLSQSF